MKDSTLVQKYSPQKQPSQFPERAADVLRTGIEPYMIISTLPYLQAVLQAVKELFCILCFIQGYNDKA